MDFEASGTSPLPSGCLYTHPSTLVSTVMFRSFFAPLNRRIIFFITAMSAIAICIVVLVSASCIILTRDSRSTRPLEDCARSLAVSLPRPFTIETARSTIHNVGNAKPWPFVEYIAIARSDSTLLEASGSFTFNMDELLTKRKVKSASGIIVSQPIIEGGEIKAYILIGSNSQFFGKGITMYLLLSSIAGTGGILASFFIARKLYKKMLQPLYDLTAAAKEIGVSKDYTLRVPYASNDELGDLVSQFNAMLDQIEKRDKLLTSHKKMLEQAVKLRTAELAKKNSQLVLEVAERREAEMIRCEVERINQHDLKSLLNLVIGYPELLLSKGNLTAQQENYIKKIEMAGYRILDMINNNLDIFKMEQGIYKLRATSVELVHLLFEIQDDITSMLTRLDVTLRITFNNYPVSTSNTFFVAGEYRLLQTLFSNLIVNAVEASNPNDIVTVAIQTDDQTITVHNNTLVPEKIQEKFFNKYATYGKEDGTGLGTYSAKLIANAHKAHISMTSTKPSGTLITVEFSEQLSLADNSSLEPAVEQMFI
ncbi:Signal transduction histidine kinase [Halodesulfovibrio aestuarii]|nr:Signal transduction histidine kinase [Halodesulfovibrio aestuarii]